MINLNINIDFGPAAVWWTAALVTGLLVYATWRVAWAWCEHYNLRQVEKRTSWTVRQPHLVPNIPLLIHRVDPKITLIRRRYGVREDEAA